MLSLVALGGNLGDRRAILRAAQRDLARLPRTRLLKASRLHETPPEHPNDGGSFLNGAALLRTRLTPRALLQLLQDVERRWGRARPPRPRGPRTLDLDLILYGDLRLQTRDLVLPHPLFQERRFVLGPATEIAPRLRDPVSGRTLAQLLGALS